MNMNMDINNDENYIDDVLHKEIFGDDKFLFKVFKYMNILTHSQYIDNYIENMTNRRNIVNIFPIIFSFKNENKKYQNNFILKEKHKITEKIDYVLSQNLKNKTLISYFSDLLPQEYHKLIEKYTNDIIKLFTKVIIIDYNNLNYNLKNMNKNLEKFSCYCNSVYYNRFNYLPNKIIYFSVPEIEILNSKYLSSSLRILNFLSIGCRNFINIKTKKSIELTKCNISYFPNSVIILQIKLENITKLKLKLKLPYKVKYLSCDNTDCIVNKFKKLKILKYFGKTLYKNKFVKQTEILYINLYDQDNYKNYVNFDINIDCNTLFFNIPNYNYKNIKIKNVKNLIFKSKIQNSIEIDIPDKLNLLYFKGENKNSILNISHIPKKINFLHIDNMELLNIQCYKDNTIINILSYDNSSNFDDRILSCSKNLILNDKKNKFIDFYETCKDKHLFANYDDNYSKSVIKDLIIQKLK